MIRVLLFGTFVKSAGERELELDFTGDGQSLADIVEEVGRVYIKGDMGVYMLALNETQADPETLVKDGDEVAIMPPFSGG